MLRLVVRYILCISIIFIITVSIVPGVRGVSPRPCPSECSNREEVVWATDESNCFVYRNECEYQNAVCRRNSTQPALRRVRKAVCQQYCRNFCLMIYDPVCAEYNGRIRTFGNSCVLSSHICSSGETYRVVPLTKCGINAGAVSRR